MIEIIRIEQTQEVTRGVIRVDGELICLTLERPWLDNQVNVSCIPSGIYVCRRADSPKFGETFEVLNVAGRTNILFHVGNTIDNSKGCILTGSSVGVLEGNPAVLNSGAAFKKFMEKLKGDEPFPLQIRSI